MLYDSLCTSPIYHDLIKRIKPETIQDVWTNMGKSDKVGPAYQKMSSELYIQGYRGGVAQMRPYLDHSALTCPRLET